MQLKWVAKHGRGPRHRLRQHVVAGMAVFDTMRHIRPDVSTVCVGLAASMGAFLLASGHKVLKDDLQNSGLISTVLMWASSNG